MYQRLKIYRSVKPVDMTDGRYKEGSVFYYGFIRLNSCFIVETVTVDEEYCPLVKYILINDFESFSQTIMVDVNCTQINSTDYEGMTPLHHAIQNSREKFAMVLIKVGCEVNIKDIRGMTPLHLAAMRNSLIIVTSLLNAGANPLTKNLNGDTPYDLAKRNKKFEIMDELEMYN